MALRRPSVYYTPAQKREVDEQCRRQNANRPPPAPQPVTWRGKLKRHPTQTAVVQRKVFRMNTQTTADISAAQLNDPEFLARRRDELREDAAMLDARLQDLRAQNDAAEAKPSTVLANARKGKVLKTVKKVVGWTLGVGVVTLGGIYVYGKLKAAGVEMPTDAIDEIGDTAAEAVAAIAA